MKKAASFTIEEANLLWLKAQAAASEAGTVRGSFSDLFTNPAYQPYDLDADQVFDADEIRINRDPFDALVCAAARALKLPLITREADIRGSGAVRVIW